MSAAKLSLFRILSTIAAVAASLVSLSTGLSSAEETARVDLRLRTGDIVSVLLPGEPAINKDYQIDNQGTIQLPEVGALQLVGLTIDEANGATKRRLSNAYRDLDRLRVFLKERRLMIQVGGFVKSPGSVNLPGGASVQAAIAAAGGLAQGAQLDRLKIFRNGREIAFDYKRYLDTGDSSLLPELLPLDQLFIPSSTVTGNVYVEFDGRTLSQAGDGGEERRSIKVFGEVNTPAIYSYRKEATVVDMLLRAGGPTRYATVEQIKIINNGEPVLFNLQSYLDSGNPALLPQLKPGATIFVPKQIEEVRKGARTVYIMGEVAKPGALELNPGTGFIDILSNAGGPTRFAETRQIRIIRESGNVDSFDLVSFTEGKGPLPPKISAGDAIFVPEKHETIEPSWLRLPPTRSIQVLGSVNKPGRYEWSTEMGFFELLAAAGGPTAKADIAHVQILENNGGKAHPTVFDMQKFLTVGGSLSSLPKLHFGVTVMVPELPQDPSDNKAQWTRQSPDRSIYVMGAVGKPGRYAITPAMSFLDILSAADGPTDKADLRDVRVAHRNQGKSDVTIVNLARYFGTGDQHLLPKIRSGDVIFVTDRNKEWLDDPKERTVRVLGAIHKPGRYRFADDMTILDLLAEAGGPTPSALQSKIIVVNLGCCSDQARTFDLLTFAKSADTRMLPVVRAGDTVYVPEQMQDEGRRTLEFLKDIAGIFQGVTSVYTGWTTGATITTVGK